MPEPRNPVSQAGWHTAKALKVPENISLLYLPSYSDKKQHYTQFDPPFIIKIGLLYYTKQLWERHSGINAVFALDLPCSEAYNYSMVEKSKFLSVY